ncbi:MAG TPA: hypothetical protein VGO28_08620 [Acidimicrobiia bacterium]
MTDADSETASAAHPPSNDDDAYGAGSTNKPDPSGGEVHDLLTRLEGLLGPGKSAAQAVGSGILPAWRRATRGESRLAVTLAILAAIGMLVALPDRIAPHPRWVLPGLALLLLIGLTVANPKRIDRQSRTLRYMSLLLIGIISLANAVTAARLVVDLVRGTGIRSPGELLLTGAAIWLTNVIVFGLWYWEFDRGGPVGRAYARKEYPDFLFPQMATPEVTPPNWEPTFVDYLYMSFTNATAFSPTDVMPLSRWAKLTMMGQSAVSLMTVALVIARAVNILR